MKVTKVESISAGPWTYVKVSTDEGIVGIGECHPASGGGQNTHAILGAIRSCGEYLEGQDPLMIEHHWQHMFRRCLFRGGPDAMAAIAGVDIALWDIAGKWHGVPVYKLLGGPTRPRVRLYTHVYAPTPEETAQKAQKAVEDGFTLVRLYPLSPDFKWGQYRNMVKTVVSYVEAVRKAVGDEIEVCIDVVCRLTPAEAIALGRALEPYGLYFYEDPIEPDNLDAMAYVASQVPVPIATGERLVTIHQFRELLNKNGAQFVRPDPGLAGGITNCRKIATLAEASYVGVVPHNPLSPVQTAVCVQLAASIYNCPVMEYAGGEFVPPKRDVVKEPIALERGYLVVPDKPGLGVELNEEALRKYPPKPHGRQVLLHADGSLRDY